MFDEFLCTSKYKSNGMLFTKNNLCYQVVVEVKEIVLCCMLANLIYWQTIPGAYVFQIDVYQDVEH